MSGAIGPGDWVECIDTTCRPGRAGVYLQALRELRLGHLYQVRGISPVGGIFLVGILSGAERLGYTPACGWIEHRFRPIYRPSESLFLTRLLDIPAPELEDA